MTDKAKWWKGTRGEWYVIAQGPFLAWVVVGPTTLPGLPPWPASLACVAGWVGLVLLVLGGACATFAAFRLGPNLTPLPHPRDHASLVEHGPYAIVRHPIYAALIVMALGWALFVNGTLTLIYAMMLFGFFDIKARREEAWLCARFPAYPAYRSRVRKFFPGLY